MKHPKTGLMEMVIQSVTRRGTATVDHLQEEFPQFTRKRIQDALTNARDARRLRVKVRGSFKARCASVWEPGAMSAPSRRSRHAEPREPVASVWELGTPRPIVFPAIEGRIYNLIGMRDAP